MTALTGHEQWNETEWQAEFVKLAGMLGWQHMHVRRSIGKGKKWVTATNVVGWPDLTCWHPRRGLIFVELKTDAKGSKTTPEQDEVHASLRAAGQLVFVWRPSDLEEAQRVLSGRAFGFKP